MGEMTAGNEQQPLLASEILLQGDTLQDVLRQRVGAVTETVQALARDGYRDWVVTGCGDSLFAGMCAEVWFPRAAGVPLRAIHALHFSRYLYRGTGPGSAVFALSYSGNTARVVEAAVAAKSRGAAVVAVTANSASRLVELADYFLPNDAISERSNCRTASFQAACMLLRLSAAALGETRRAQPMAQPAGLPDAVRSFALECGPNANRIVQALPDGLTFTSIGGGYSYPISCYGAAKLYEAATVPAHSSELEQFVHCEIFPVDNRSCVVITAPRGASFRRAVEVADGLTQLEAVTVGISDEPGFAQHCRHFIQLPQGWDESLIPFLACVPHQYLALYLALRAGDDPDLVSNKWVNRPLIERSEQWAEVDYLTREVIS
jgi:glucosamine--fructose-6-phosphate aminotransferase (isomerizing)